MNRTIYIIITILLFYKNKFNIIRENKGNEKIYNLKYIKDLNSKYYRKNVIINLNKL